MARRGRSQGDASIIAALVVVGAFVWLVQALWPLLIVFGIGALILYVARRFEQGSPSAVEVRPDVELEPKVTIRRSRPGAVVLELSVGTEDDTPEEHPVDPDTVWVPAGKAVKVGPYTLPGGMIYVGERLHAVDNWRGDEPALIDPRLPTDAANPDREGAGMTYWPSYGGIPAQCRAAYLEWLASGRTRPDIGIGYVFLFFYGLERRLLVDSQRSSAARAERDQLVGEVQRLLDLYGDNGSFRRYAGSLLDAMRAQAVSGRIYDAVPPPEREGYELPYTLRVALAQLAADGRPVPAEWAWSWLLCSPETSLRTPARRCPEEFRALFLARYGQKFGSGISVKRARKKLSLSYRPASASFPGMVEIPAGSLNDITTPTAPQGLRELAEACAEDLAAYSRWVGRNPTERGSVTAAALLPRELLDSASSAVQPLRAWLERSVASPSPVVVSTPELLGFWPETDNGKLAKRDSVAFTQMLATLGYALEPDVRFGGPPLTSDTPSVVFRLPDDSPASPSAAYDAATLILHLGAALADADEAVTAEEERHLETQLESALHLLSPERARLRAHLTWLLAAKPGTGGLKKRIATLGDGQRRAVGKYLVALAGADGRFEASEVTALTKMYRLLGFTAAEAYSDVHELASTATPPASEPVTVQRAESIDTGFSIPPPPGTTKGARHDVFRLDMERVQATLAETKAVAALLTDIFAEDESTAPPVPPASSDVSVNGLDGRHSAFARAVAERAEWSRDDLEALAAKHNLLPEGALDTINEAALDRCGEPLCEGDDPVTVTVSVAKELLA